MKVAGFLLAGLFSLPLAVPAQMNMYLSGGFAYISGDGGLNGYNAGIEGLFNRKVALAFDYDRGWDTNRLGAFALTSIGAITTRSRIQDFLIGPRFYFPNKHVFWSKLTPLAEGQFGVTH